MACAAALEVIDILQEGALENARVVGAQLREGLDEVGAAVSLKTDVRGLGMMLGIEFRNEDGTPATSFVSRMCELALEEDLLLLTCGSEGNVLRLMPPTTLTSAEADETIRLVKAAVARASA